MRLRTALAAAGALAMAACGTTTGRLSAACTQGAPRLAAALEAAPERVVLEDGTRLSDCIRRADDYAEIQEVAAGATALADQLAASSGRDEDSAVRLGYLIGAARRGAQHTGGIHAELIRRLESAAARVPASRHAAYNRGVAAGTRSG